MRNRQPEGADQVSTLKEGWLGALHYMALGPGAPGQQRTSSLQNLGSARWVGASLLWSSTSPLKSRCSFNITDIFDTMSARLGCKTSRARLNSAGQIKSAAKL